MKIKSWLLPFVLFSVVITGILHAAEPKVKVLLMTGYNNHDWKVTTPLIEKCLNDTGRFEIVVTTEFEKMDPKKLGDYDVILSNWNLLKEGHQFAKLNWSPELREAYVNFVKEGGGQVAVHGGTSSFFNWKDYQEIGVATWGKGTHHGPNHEFEVRMDTQEHPVTKGLASFKSTDELWESIVVHSEGATVLTSNFASKKFQGDDKWEPSTLVSEFGKGRTAYTSLGHDAKSFESEGFRVLLARLVEWSATGKVTIAAPAVTAPAK